MKREEKKSKEKQENEDFCVIWTKANGNVWTRKH